MSSLAQYDFQRLGDQNWNVFPTQQSFGVFRIAVTTIAALRRNAAGEAKIWSNLCDEEGFPFGRLQNAMSIAEFLSDTTKFF